MALEHRRSDMTNAGPPSGSGPAAPGALRLIFEYQGSDIRLVSRQRVAMAVPPGDPIEGRDTESGFWVEVRDGAGNPLHRRVMHDPVRHDVEVFSDDPAQSLARVPVPQPAGTFAVLIPDIAAADHVALVSSPPGQHLAIAPAAEVARFSLVGPVDREGEADGHE
jgi:hypothetical protein